MFPANPDDQSCFEPGLRVLDAKDPDSTSRGANRIHSHSRRVSGKDDGLRLSNDGERQH
jgi:hypothetical protein